MSEGSDQKNTKDGRSRCRDAYTRHLKEGIVDLDKGYENDPLITVYKLEEILPRLDHFLPPVRQSGHWVTLVTRGSGEKTIENHHFQIRENTLFIAGRRAAQSSRYYFPGVKGYTLILDIDKLSNLLYNETIIRERKVLKGMIRPYLYLEKPDAARLEAIMESMYREWSANGEEITELMALKIAELLITCDRLFERSRLFLKSGQPQPVLEKLYTLLDKYGHHEHGAAFYRKELEIKGRELNRILRRNALGSTSNIIRNKLITDMKLLLISTRLTIRSIARSLGFSSAKSCSRYFSRNTGVSPTVFRGKQHAVIRSLVN